MVDTTFDTYRTLGAKFFPRPVTSLSLYGKEHRRIDIGRTLTQRLIPPRSLLGYLNVSDQVEDVCATSVGHIPSQRYRGIDDILLGMAAKKSKSKDKDSNNGLNYVRGGSICDASSKEGHLIRGSGQPAVCRKTAGPDPRPRWRVAGK
jgi:hypothetical protein